MSTAETKPRLQRIGRRTRVRPEAISAYRDWHKRIWAEIVELTREAGIRNYTIYMDGPDLFSYFEVEDLTAAMAFLSRSDLSNRWQTLMAPLMDAPVAESPWQVLEEVLHLD